MEARNRTTGPARTSPGPEATSDGAVVAAAVVELLKPYAPVLEELRTASWRPHSRFNIRYHQENPYAILLPYLSRIKGICQMLKTRAVAELALGETEQAFADVQLMLYLADSVKDEPILISYLVRLANFQIAMQAIWEGLAERQWSDSQMAQLQERLQHALRGERAFGVRIAEMMHRSPDRGLMLDQLGGGPTPQNQLPPVAAVLVSLVPRGWFYFEAVNYARLFDETIFSDHMIESSRVNPGRVRQSRDRLASVCDSSPIDAIWNHRVLSALLLPALGNVFPKAAYAQTALRLLVPW